jgi:hypothetical protein
MTGVIATIPKFQFSNATGTPLANGTLTVYLSGTTTLTNTWQDYALTSLNTNPIILDSRGECVLWLDPTVTYKFVLKNSSGVVQWTQDNISGAAPGSIVSDYAASNGASKIGGGDQVVSSISTLRTLLKTSPSKNAYVTGYYAAGDGGGGAYFYDSTDTASADNGGTIIVAADGGRWKLSVVDSVSNGQFGAKNDSVSDDTTFNQNAINWCILKNKDLNINGLSRITASLNIDRQVDGAAFDSYFNIFSDSGGGFYVDTAIPIFSSTIAFTTAPVTQLSAFINLRFIASSSLIAAYVLNGARFLRTQFTGCSFSKIKLLVSTTYVQSIYFTNCNARRWTGTFFKVTPQAYDIQVIGGLYEAGDACFDISSPIGCKFWTQIEGMTGTALKINGAQSVDISCYLEANGLDMDCRTGGLSNFGINLHGSYISHLAGSGYSVKWGTSSGCVSLGNWHTGDMHDLQADSLVEINDKAQGSISNGDAATNRGYRESSSALSLIIRGSASASYTTSAVSSKYTINGRLVTVHFTCTLTSTATNPADQIFITGGLFETSSINGVLCGNLEVVGSTQNNGISSAFVSSLSPLRVLSSIAILPANVSGNAFTVRGLLVYSTNS